LWIPVLTLSPIVVRLLGLPGSCGKLAVMLPAAMFANGWLTLKLMLVVLYIVLGTFALKRGRTPRVRATSYLAALLTFGTIIGIALAHHPLGWLLRFTR